MANYFLQDDGNITREKKKKRNNYILDDKGNVKLLSTTRDTNLPIEDDFKNENYGGLKGKTKQMFDVVTGGISEGIKGLAASTNILSRKVASKSHNLKTNPLAMRFLADTKKAVEDKNINKSIQKGRYARSKAKGVWGGALDIGGSIGRMAPQFIAPNPASAVALGFANYGGGAYNDAKEQGYDEKSALKYGAAIGTMEMTMEKVLGGFSKVYGKTKSGAAVQNVIDKVIPKLIKNKAVRQTLAEMGSEGLEEFVQEYTENIAKDTLLDKKGALKSTLDNVKSQENLENALYSGLIGAITAGVTDASINAINKVNNNIPTVEEIVENKPQQKEEIDVRELVNNKENINTKEEVKENIPDNILKSQEPISQAEEYKTMKQENINQNNENNLIENKVEENNKLLEANNIIDKTDKNLTNTRYKDIVEWVDINTIDDIKEYDRGSKPTTSNIQDLANDIKENGFKEPLMIDFNPYNGNIKLAEGNHRLAAAKMLGLDKVPVWASRSSYMEDGIKYVNPEDIIPYEKSDAGTYYYEEMKPSLLGDKFNPKKETNLPAKEIKKTNLPKEEVIDNKKIKELNPTEIANLAKEDADTTPILPTKESKKGNRRSGFAKNLENIDVLSEETKKTLLSDEEVKSYNKVTNEDSLEIAKNRLDKNGKEETMRWLGKDSKNVDSTDVAEGWILLEQYQDKIKNTKDAATKEALNKSMVEIAKKQRNILTNAGQTIQAGSIMQRFTPEGMIYYAQSELSEAYNKIKEGKTKEWIDKHTKDFELTPQETEFIMNNMKSIDETTDAYVKKVKLAEIQKIISNKLPSNLSNSVKAWMRISMLFNPKTQVRNILGNAVILPTNIVGDKISSAIDSLISKKTGVRTRGSSMEGYLTNLKSGVKESVSEGKKGISTRDITGNRFEFGEGKSFNDNTAVGKALNKVDNFLGTMLDAGDRGFFKAEYEKSLKNQMELNKVDTPTPEMIEIAMQDAQARTWQDSNAYTQTVLSIRRALNLNKSTGFGDVLIPFAKTPANLTKAIIDYSPIGLINSAVKGYKLKNSLSNGQFDVKTQHEFVDTLGKAAAGSLLYILGTALAKAKITTGENDDDKDVSNFMRNILGINPYSIKVGNKSFKYDWAQPVAAPIAITANMEKKRKENSNIIEKVLSTMDTGLNILFEQSFLENMKDLLSRPGEIGTKISEQILDLPARAIPTLFKQIADMVDPTQRTTFEYGKPLETAKNKVKSKIPFVSKTLPKMVDTLGRDIKKYGGENNLYNVFLNPANVNKGKLSESGKEIYRIYQELGDKTIMPRVAPYYINVKGEKINLSAKEKAQFQKISGEIIEKEVKNLLKNKEYKDLIDEEKQDIITDIINYSYNKAREEVVGLPMSDMYSKASRYVEDGGNLSDYYTNKEEIDYYYTNPSKYNTIVQIEPYKDYLKHNEGINNAKDKATDRKQATINYVNGLNLSIPKKAMLIKMNYKSFKDYDTIIVDYINNLNKTIQEKTEILKQLGFKVENGRVY